MWSEKHVPAIPDECAWSRQKRRELTEWLESRGILGAPERRRNGSTHQSLLMYGPSGCGKLSVLRSILQTRCRPVNGFECTVPQLQTLLQDWLSISTKPLAEADVLVLKELPFASETMRRDLRRALLQYARAIKKESPLVVFVHTVQDTHSEKVDLYSHYSMDFVEHPSVHKFRCTAITARNAALRLKAVCAAEGVYSSNTVVDGLAESCGGDLRHALLQLQWLCLIPSATRECAGEISSQISPADSRKRSRRTATKADSGFFALLDSPSVSTVAISKQAETCTSFRRDEYVDVSRAAARLLVQKYTTNEVLGAISTTPTRLMGYVENNMHLYFSNDQLDDFARCASSASEFDAAAGIESSLLLFDSSSITEPMFHVFGKAYKCFHERVEAPKALVPLYPPPVVSSSCPVLIERSNNEDSSYSIPRGHVGDAKSVATLLPKLRDSCELFMVMSTEQLRVDILPFLPIVLFDLQCSGERSKSPVVEKPVAPIFAAFQKAAQKVAPKRTIFRSNPVAKPMPISFDTISVMRKFAELSAPTSAAAATLRGAPLRADRFVAGYSSVHRRVGTFTLLHHPAILCSDPIEEVSD